MSSTNQPIIGTLAESSLHASLKEHFAKPGDLLEHEIEGYVIDIVAEKELIEIQTGNFSAMKKKLDILLPDYKVHLIHPIIQDKWITRVSAEGEVLKKRKSPKRGRIEELFKELLRIPKQAQHPNLTVSVVFVQVDEFWHDDGEGSWRRKHWSIADKKVKKILSTKTFSSANDYTKLLPQALPTEFTNKQLAKILGIQNTLATKMTYALKKMNLIDVVGKQGRAYLYTITV